MARFVALCLASLLLLAAHAQPSSIYQNITTSNGLPSNYVFAVCEDEAGFLWAGTDKGLCRFDGFRWLVWDKDNGLPGNYINSVQADNHGGLWLSISDKGFFHFNFKTGKLQALQLPAAPVLSSEQTDNDGNFYMEAVSADGVYGGYLFAPGGHQKPEVVFEKKDIPLLLKGAAAKKVIYCASNDTSILRKAAQLVPSRWRLVPVRLPHKDFFSMSLYMLSEGTLLTNKDYYKFSKSGRQLVHLPLFPQGNTYAFSCATVNGLYVYNVKTGLYFIDHKNQKTFYNSASGLGTDYVNHVYQTRDGTVIISTLGAGLQLIKNSYRKTFTTGNQMVRTVLPSTDGWYLLAGERIFKAAQTNPVFEAVTGTIPSALNLQPWGSRLLVGTLKGIAQFKSGPGQLTQLPFTEFTAGISSIIPTPAGLLAGTYGVGLISFNSNLVQGPVIPFPLRIIEKLVVLPRSYAALSYEDGLLLIDTFFKQQRHLLRKDGLLSNSVYSVHTQNDSLWIGTKGGVAVYDGNRVVTTIPFASGYENEKALLCFHCKQNMLWVVGTRGLYAMRLGLLQPLASHPIIADDDVVTAAAFSPERNELAIGSNKTFSLVALDAVHPDTSVAAPVLTGILLDGVEQKVEDFDVPYQFQQLSFTLAPLSASPFRQAHFYYKLQGLSDEWRLVKDSLSIAFAALRPGAYRLWVKSVNADGYESAALLQGQFVVLKPFWQQTPFVLLWVALIIVCTTLVMREVEKARRRKKETALLVQQTLQTERERIAKDLHDHLGTNLATMIAQTDNIESRLLRGELQQASHTVHHLSAQSRETMSVLRETIWAVQETEHRLADFVIRIRTFLLRLYESTAVEWEVKVAVHKEVVLSPTQTLHLFRIVQEASQNILKHSGAAKAQYAFTLNAGRLRVCITDDGCGFVAAQTPPRNGLINIHERVKLIGGTVVVEAQPSVTITIELPL